MIRNNAIPVSRQRSGAKYRKDIWAILLCACVLTPGGAAHAKATSDPSAIDDLLKASPEQAPRQEALTPVRQAALGETAQLLGSQRGFGERSKEIIDQINGMSAKLDKAYQFNAMMMGAGFLPPVIDEATGAVTMDQTTMRVTGKIYTIIEPARPVMVAPTWRDWLMSGLDPTLRPPLPEHASLFPRDEAERLYWRSELKKSYEAGRGQANEIFELNKAKLERTYLGMRRFYQLYAAGVVTAPQVVSDSTMVDREDGNTVLIGSTYWRIVKPTDFVDDHKQWRPLGK